MWQSELHGTANHPPEQGIPVMITWSYGGINVAVEGSWDNWTTRWDLMTSLSVRIAWLHSTWKLIIIVNFRKALQRGKDHSILIVLPSGIYHYRFIVDDEQRYTPDLPYVADEMGRIYNLLDGNVCIFLFVSFGFISLFLWKHLLVLWTSSFYSSSDILSCASAVCGD